MQFMTNRSAEPCTGDTVYPRSSLLLVSAILYSRTNYRRAKGSNKEPWEASRLGEGRENRDLWWEGPGAGREGVSGPPQS